MYQEGANENDLVLLKDNRTLWAVMRTVRRRDTRGQVWVASAHQHYRCGQDSCDGEPSHRTLPFLTSRSTDRGRSWSPSTPLPDDMLSATPKATVLGNGALLVSGGRPGVDLWVSADGFGEEWQRYSLPTYHNQLVSKGYPDSWACTSHP